MNREFMDDEPHRFKLIVPNPFKVCFEDGCKTILYLISSLGNCILKYYLKFPLGTVGREGCYLTAITNSLKKIDFKLPGKSNVITVMDLVEYVQENKFNLYEGSLKSADLFKKLAIGVREKKFSHIDPTELASLLNQKSPILLCMTSPCGGTICHWVNVEKIIYKNGEPYVSYSETNRSLREKYGEMISLKKLQNDEKAKLRIIDKEKNEVESSNDGKGDGELDENSKKTIQLHIHEQTLKNTISFRKGHSIGFMFGEMLINYKSYKI